MLWLWCTMSFVLGGITGIAAIAVCQAAGRVDAATEEDDGKDDSGMEKEVIQGYEIMKRAEVGRKGFVLAHNPKAPSPYVTWKHNSDKNSMYWGHYFEKYSDALRDFNKRVRAEKEYER